MKKTFYIQIDNENRVTDIITYPYSDYKKIELDTPLPTGSYSGIYQLIDNKLVLNKEWENESVAQQILTMRTELGSNN